MDSGKEDPRNSASSIKYPSALYKIVGTKFPFVGWLYKYRWRDSFCGDLFAGLTLAFFQVPECLAFAMVANVEAVAGLYSASFTTFVYLLFGTASLSSFGPIPVASMIAGGPISVLNTTTIYSYQEVSCTLTFVIGVWYMTACIFHMEVLMVGFNKPFTSGFVSGCSVHIISKSIKKLFGLNEVNHYGIFSPFNNFSALYEGLDCISFPTLYLSISIILILITNLYIIRPYLRSRNLIVFPTESCALIVTCLLSHYFNFSRHGISTLGTVTQGIPSPTLPVFNLIPDLCGPALGIALITFTTSTRGTISFNGNKLNPNQELLAFSVANIASSFAQCITSGNSALRTAVGISVGMKTLMASFVSAAAFLIFILFGRGSWEEKLLFTPCA